VTSPPMPPGLPPDGYGVPYAAPAGPPAVLTWFKVYAIGMALVYVLVTVGGVAMYVMADEFAGDPEMPPGGVRIQGAVMAVIGVPLAGLFAAGALLPRRPWVWIYDLVLIAIGLTSCCFWPASIPLLIFWIKPEARGWFGRS
jgi:hypothetical protein